MNSHVIHLLGDARLELKTSSLALFMLLFLLKYIEYHLVWA